jgi:hypothetical protein
MRNPEDLTSEEQEAFIEKYVTTRCHFEKYGFKFENFIEHKTVESKTAGQLFVIGMYDVDPEADFDKIEKKIKLYNLHQYFVIFALF